MLLLFFLTTNHHNHSLVVCCWPPKTAATAPSPGVLELSTCFDFCTSVLSFYTGQKLNSLDAY